VCTFDEAKFEVVVYLVGVEASKNVLHQHASTAAQFYQAKWLFDCIGEGVQGSYFC
jgi:hypothetical protein